MRIKGHTMHKRADIKSVRVVESKESGCWHVFLCWHKIGHLREEIEVAQHCTEEEADRAAAAIIRFAKEETS